MGSDHTCQKCGGPVIPGKTGCGIGLSTDPSGHPDGLIRGSLRYVHYEAHCTVVVDGYGGAWAKCGPDCSLDAMRPGKVQCDGDGANCPSRQSKEAPDGE